MLFIQHWWIKTGPLKFAPGQFGLLDCKKKQKQGSAGAQEVLWDSLALLGRLFFFARCSWQCPFCEGVSVAAAVFRDLAMTLQHHLSKKKQRNYSRSKLYLCSPIANGLHLTVTIFRWFTRVEDI